MKQENVDGLYEKLGKAVPKSKRESLKASLVKADDSKYSALSNIELASRSPLKGINGLICFFATLFGVIFLVCNMIAFLYISPKYASYRNYSAKLSDDLSEYNSQLYYSQLADYGVAEKTSSRAVILEFEEDYNAMVKIYDELSAALEEKDTAYNKVFTTYSTNLTYIGNKTINYLNYKVQLAKLEEPGEGDENYETLKAEYDAKVAELNAKITDYESKVAGLEDDKAAVDTARAEYDEAAVECVGAMRQIIEWQKVYQQSEAYKTASLYNIYFGDTSGIIEYMNNCKTRLDVQLESYESALNTCKKATQNISDLPAIIEADENLITQVAENYEAAKNDLKEYAATVAECRVEYNKYVSDNAEDLAKYNKLIADVENALKTDGQISEELEGELAAAEAWIEAYNAEIKEYTDTLRDYNTVLSLLGLTNYSNLLVQRINLTADIEAETDESSKATLTADLEKLNESITEEEAAIAVYQEIIDGSETWTEEHYINYCLNNTEDENFTDYKKAFEVISDAENTIGNSEKITLLNDKFELSKTSLSKEEAENQALVAYYSAEQHAARLQTALNIAYELATNLSDYYSGIEKSSKIDWLSVTEDMRETVQSKLSYKEHVKLVDEYLARTNKVELSEFFFDVFDVTDGEQLKSLKVKANNFANTISKYTALVNDVNAFATDANSAVADYQELPSVLEMLLMIFDLIIIVIYAAYFVYYVYDVNSVAKEKNYEKISDMVNS